MKRKILIVIGFCSFIGGFSQRVMTETESREFISQFIKESKKINTLQSDFVQMKKVSLMKYSIVASGKMVFQSPNSLSWQYLKPNQSGFIFKNDKIYLYKKGKKLEVDTKSKMFEKLSQLIVGSTTGSIFQNPDFQASFYQDGNMKIIRLVPKIKQLQKFVKQVDMYFKNHQSTATKVIMIEKSGDNTEIEFSNTQINTSIISSLFSD